MTCSPIIHQRPVESLELVDSFHLSVEAVIDLNPDLVVLSYDPGGAVAAFEAVGIPTLLFGTAGTLDDVYDQIIAVGRAAASRPRLARW